MLVPLGMLVLVTAVLMIAFAFFWTKVWVPRAGRSLEAWHDWQFSEMKTSPKFSYVSVESGGQTTDSAVMPEAESVAQAENTSTRMARRDI